MTARRADNTAGNEPWLAGIPICTIPRWKLALLRVAFPRRWWLQRGGNIYIIRDPEPRP